MASDHADETIVADPDPLGAITAFAVDPQDSRTLYVSASKGSSAALFVSHDSGDTWERKASLEQPAMQIWLNPDSKRIGEEIVLGGSHSITSQGASGIRKFQAPASVTFTSLSAGFGARSNTVLYGTSDQGAFVSRDGGSTWQKCILPGTGAEVRAVATSLRHPGIAYLSFNNLELDGESWQGVAKTTDYGRNWTLVWKEARNPAANIHDAWITERFGPGWGENPLMLGVAGDDPNLCYATDLGRTMKTADGGPTWTAVYSRKVPRERVDQHRSRRNYKLWNSFRSIRPSAVSSSPTRILGSSAAKMVGSLGSVRLPECPNLGSTRRIGWCLIPIFAGGMWSVNSGTHDLPRPKMWRHSSILTYKGGVCRSDDGGKTWMASNSGMEETAATHILLDPKSPPNARTLYVAAFGRGVYKSTDDGRTWTLKNHGMTQTATFCLAIGAELRRNALRTLSATVGERQHWECGRWRYLSFDRWRAELDTCTHAGRSERAERVSNRSKFSAALISGGVGASRWTARRRRRYLPV